MEDAVDRTEEASPTGMLDAGADGTTGVPKLLMDTETEWCEALGGSDRGEGKGESEGEGEGRVWRPAAPERR